MTKVAQYLIVGGSLRVERTQFPVIDETTGEPTGESTPAYAAVIEDPSEPATYTVPFDDSVKEQILRVLTGGIIIP